MSRFGVWLVDTINKRFPTLEMHRELDRDKLSIQDYQEREYEEAQRVCPEFGPLWNLKDKEVLDVGSGLGGKPAYYNDLGARHVTAIDIRLASVKSALDLSREQQARIRLMVADAACMPFGEDRFDIIVSINVLEHVEDLQRTLAECKRVLKPGGLMFLHFPPFYSPWGAHLEGWINFPWPHVFFSNQTLIKVAQRVEERRRNNANYIRSAQVDWAHVTRLPDLNRATARYCKHLIQSLDLIVIKAQMLPFGRHYLNQRGWLACLLLRTLTVMSNLPLLREVVTTKMMFILTKA